MKRYPVAPGRPGRGAGSVGHRVWRLAIGTLLFALPFVLLPVGASLASSAPHVTPDDGLDTSTCAMCHRAHTAFGVVSRQQPGSWESTGSALVLSQPSNTGDQVLCLTCHGIDRTGSTIDVQSDVMRASVHSMTPEPSDYGPVDKQCSSCHDAHGSARDPETGQPYASLLRSSTSTGTVFYRAEEYCATCHFDPRDEQSNRFDGLTVYRLTAHSAGLAAKAPATGITCSICHAAHGSDLAPLIRDVVVPSGEATTPVEVGGNDRSLCYVCHEVAHVTYDGSETYETSVHALSEIAVPIVAEWPRSEEATRLAGECQNCHNPMGADDGEGDVVPKLLEDASRELCYSCHNEELASATHASEETSAVVDMASAGVKPYGEDSEFEEGAELVVAWDPENLPLSYSALHVHTQQRGVDAPRELEGPRRYLSGSRSGAMAQGDIYGLGEVELVVANPAGPELTVVRYDPLAGLAAATYAIEETATLLAVGDFIKDTNADLEIAAVSVRLDGESVLRVYRFDETTGFNQVAADFTLPAGAFATGIAAGYLANTPATGVADIAITAGGDDQLWIIRETSPGSGLQSETGSPYPMLAGPRGPSVGDGIVAVANADEAVDTLSVFAYGPKTRADYTAVIAGGAQAWDTAIGDFLPGAESGVAVALRSETDANAVALFEINGTTVAPFSAPIDTGDRFTTSTLAVGDLNGDGRDQLVAANAGVFSRTEGLSVSPSVHVFTENGAGTALEIRPEGTRWGGGVEMAGGTPTLVVADLGPVGRSRHPASAVAGAHDSAEEGDFDRHAECVDCHNVHAMNGDPATAPNAYGVIAGAWGVDVSGDPPALALKEEIEFEYELCFKCHTVGWGKTAPPSRDVFAEFNRDPITGSVHPVMVDSSKGRVYCVDCHGNANAEDGEPAGPHVSTSAPLLREPFFAARSFEASLQLCYNTCHHEFDVYYGGNTGSAFYDQTSGVQLHARHVNDFEMACQSCHTNHGSPNSFLIREDVDWVEAAQGGGCFTPCHADESLAGNAYSRVDDDVDVYSVDLVAGTLEGGYTNDLSALQVDDTSYYVVRELGGSNDPSALRVDLGFDGVTTVPPTVPTSFEVIGYYYGPSNRQLQVQVYDYKNETWVSLGIMPRVTTDYVAGAIEPLPAYSFPIPNNPDFVSSGGQMSFRLDQPQSGNQNHLLYLDRVWLRY